MKPLIFFAIASGSLITAVSLSQCGGDSANGLGVFPGADGAVGGGDGASSTGDGGPGTEADQYFRCNASKLEKCVATSDDSTTCGSAKSCSTSEPCFAVSCTCGAAGTVVVSGANRCEQGCCKEVPALCRDACASADAGLDGSMDAAAVFDSSTAVSPPKKAPYCTKWETIPSCQGEAVCSYLPDAGCAPAYGDCKAEAPIVVTEGMCKGTTAPTKVYPWRCSPELHVVTIYERDVKGDPAEVPVDIERTDVPIVLALNAFDRTRWVLRMKPGVKLTKILLTGDSDVIGADGVPIVFLEQTFCSTDLSSTNWDDCNDQKLVRALEGMSGLHVSSWVGCYYGTSFKLR